MEEKKIETLNHLNEINKTQSGLLTNTARIIMTSVFALNFSLVLKGKEYVDMCNVITCFFVVLYFASELLHYYLGVSKARILFEELMYNRKDTSAVCAEMTKQSGFTFVVFQVKLIILVLTVFMQLYYFGSMILL